MYNYLKIKSYKEEEEEENQAVARLAEAEHEGLCGRS